MKIPKRLRYSVLLIFIISSLFVGYFINRQESASNSNVRIIEIRDDGFHPDSLTISKGTMVKFVNSKGGPSWPASDPHPTHTSYSEFDSMMAVQNGGEWDYVFRQVGAWKFHDHLSPYFTGKVIVIENNNSDSSAFGCEKNSETKTCWEESLLSTLNKYGLEKVLEEVSLFYETKPLFAGVCHDIMHSIGHKAYKNYLQDKDSVLSPKAFYCANGFYHGFMASFLNSNPDLNKAREFCSLVGRKLNDAAPDAELQCYHGIGHGLLEDGFRKISKEISVEEVMNPAIQNCEEVSDNKDKLYRCASGVFNGIANFYISGEHNFKININNPFADCENQLEKHKESCYGNYNSVIYWLSGNDFEKALKYIVAMKDTAHQVKGVRYLSGLATLSLAKTDPEKSILICRNVGKLWKPCLEGIAHGFLEHGNPNKEWVDAVTFCENSYMLKDETEACFHYTLYGLNGWYSIVKSREICNSLKPDYRKYCSHI